MRCGAGRQIGGSDFPALFMGTASDETVAIAATARLPDLSKHRANFTQLQIINAAV